jgi:uncharacterized protein (TIGR00730 family)
MKKTICVYSSSSDAVAGHFFKAAKELGALMAQKNRTLVYGGGSIGLMGEMARSVHQNGGAVVGVIPDSLNGLGITYESADQLIVTRTMRERKEKMENLADAFIGLPGGFGTLEELLEIITLKQIQLHNKPIVILNVAGFYKHLIELFEHIFSEDFSKSMHRQLYFVTPDAREALDYIDSYTPPAMPEKWF